LLEGAKFEVYRAATTEDTITETILCNGIQYAVVPVTVNGEKLVLTTDENGYAVSPELSCGIYFLVESEAPAGYNLPAEAFCVTVNSSAVTTVTTVEIPNQRGNILPETGGIGTTVFTISGALLITLAGMLLIAKRRKSA
jgi:LPXTG-motif cell wall-anchored protein